MDPYGTDIWIEGANKNEPKFHESICVGDPKGAYKSYSFGLTSRWQVFIPWRKGQVYEDEECGGKKKKILKTTPEEDKQALGLLEQLVGQEWNYGLTYGNCRQFTRQMFDFFNEDMGFGKQPGGAQK